MADFEAIVPPTWSNVMTGQQNLRDAANKTITLEDAKT
jgi:malate synthase